jgi:hypothetical protein
MFWLFQQVTVRFAGRPDPHCLVSLARRAFPHPRHVGLKYREEHFLTFRLSGFSVLHIVLSISVSSGPPRTAALARLDPTSILRIHRHEDGFITLHDKRGGEFKNLGAVRPKALPMRLDAQVERLRQDAYFSLNAYWFGEGIPDDFSRPFRRNREHLRYLCTVFCDLDCHKVGISPSKARERVRHLEKRGAIPAASGYIFSGRGLWALWLLRDPKKPDQAPRAFPEKIDLYDEIQRELGQLLVTAGLGLDVGAKDPARLARIPGSVNSKTSAAVRYEFKPREDGSLITYTLAELKQKLGIKPKHQPTNRQPKRNVPKRRAGFDALIDRRLREFKKLRLMRGGFQEGCRNYAVLIYAWLLRKKGFPHGSIKQQAFKLGGECQPRFSQSECGSALETALFSPNMNKLRDQTIADWLDITPEESGRLEKLPPASGFGVQPSVSTKSRRVDPEKRREHVRRRVKKLGSVPTTREMARLLGGDGFAVSHVTAAADYKRLGLNSETGTNGRVPSPPRAASRSQETARR